MQGWELLRSSLLAGAHRATMFARRLDSCELGDVIGDRE